MTNKRPGYATYRKIEQTLEGKIESLDNGYCRYKPNWSDADVAKTHSVSPSSVAFVRKQIYGNLQDSPRAASITIAVALTARIEALEQRVKAISEANATFITWMRLVDKWAHRQGFNFHNGHTLHQEESIHDRSQA